MLYYSQVYQVSFTVPLIQMYPGIAYKSLLLSGFAFCVLQNKQFHGTIPGLRPGMVRLTMRKTQNQNHDF